MTNTKSERGVAPMSDPRPTWNYRTLKQADPDGTVVFSIHEVHYDAQGTVTSWTEQPVGVMSETLKGLQGVVFQQFVRALYQPVLDVTVDPPRELTTMSGLPKKPRRKP